MENLIMSLNDRKIMCQNFNCNNFVSVDKFPDVYTNFRCPICLNSSYTICKICKCYFQCIDNHSKHKCLDCISKSYLGK